MRITRSPILRCVSTALVACLPAVQSTRAADTILLTRDSDIRIIEIGEFENAQSSLRELLAKYLLRALRKDALPGTGNKVTFLLEPRAPDWQRLPKAALADRADIDAFTIRIQPLPDGGIVRIGGTTVLATGFGVMHFLEKYLGITWLFPGELGLDVPERENVELQSAEERIAPEFVSRLCTGFAYRDTSIPAKRFVYEGLVHRQSLFFYGHDYFKSLKLHHLASPSHNMIRVFPLSTRTDHPELLPVKDGERWVPPDKDTPRGRVGWWQAWHPCYTNPKAAEIAAAKATEAFASGQYCFSLGINDGRRVICACAQCEKVGWPNSYYQFVADVAARVKDHYPPQLIGVLAYGDVSQPPADLALPENVLVMCASGGPERHLTWRDHAANLGTYEWAHGQGYWIPHLPLAAMKQNAAFYKQNRIRFFRSEIHPLWAFDGPRVYLRLRQLWDPGLDLDSALVHYCLAAFGEGWKPMLRFYQHWAAKRDPDLAPVGVSPLHAGVWPHTHWRNPTAQFAECGPSDFEFSAQCIAAARAASRADLVQKRLDMVAAFVDDSTTLFRMSALKNDVFMGTAANSATTVQAALELQNRREGILRGMHEHPEWFLGTSAGVDEKLQPSWEQRGVMTLPREVDNALCTALVALHDGSGSRLELHPPLPPQFQPLLQPFERQSVQVHTRPQHGWYPEDRFVPLTAPRRGELIEFAATAGDQRIEGHATLSGRRKVHWLAGFVVNAEFAGNTAYQLELNSTGRNGVLHGRVASGWNNTAQTEAALLESFATDGRSLNAKIVVRPTYPGIEVGSGTGGKPQKGMVNIYLTWTPNADQAPLTGAMRISQLTFGPGDRPL